MYKYIAFLKHIHTCNNDFRIAFLSHAVGCAWKIIAAPARIQDAMYGICAVLTLLSHPRETHLFGMDCNSSLKDDEIGAWRGGFWYGYTTRTLQVRGRLQMVKK
jgi:hypothetical protein